VLVVSASLGAGHDGAANELARRLRETGHEVEVVDYLQALHGFARLLVKDGYEAQIKLIPSSYEWLYRTLETQRWALAIGRFIIRKAKRDVRRWLEPGWDAVVSTYPLASQTLGLLKRNGELTVPLVTFLTDPSVHAYWTSADVDLNLAVFPQTAGDAMHLCPSVPAVAVGPLVHPRHRDRLTAEERRELRREIGVPEDARVGLIVAGSWGVGDVKAAVRAVLADAVCTPVVACGRNESLRAQLAAIPGVVALGWRTDMHRVMAVSDVLLQNAGGLTCLEAMVSGLPVVSHACIPGHGFSNAEALEDAGLAPWTRDDAHLAGTVDRSLHAVEGWLARRRAEELTGGDPSVLVAAIAATGSVPAALQAVPAAWAPPARREDPTAQRRAEHRLRVGVRPPRLSTAPRRRTRRAAIGLTSLLVAGGFAGTTGVAAATAHGYGWSQATQATVVVRVDTLSGGVGPLTESALRSQHAAAAVSGRYALAHPGTVRQLVADGVPIVNGGWGAPTNELTETQRDLLSARTALRAAGAEPTAWVAGRSIDAVDLTVARAAREHALVPAATVPAQGDIAVPRRGGVVVLDATSLSDAAAAERITALTSRLSEAGLTVRELPSWDADHNTAGPAARATRAVGA
jgi:UDP-N-acetylglucosamine:LPS N-acetylglucosamine transferase